MQKSILIRVDDLGLGHDRFLKLATLAESHSIPLNVAVIPALLTQIPLSSLPDATYFQHGLTHASQVSADLRKSEFPESRDIQKCLNDIQEGQKILKKAMANIFPAFCPPWNRMNEELWKFLPDLGFTHALGGTEMIQIQNLRYLPYHFDLHTKHLEKRFSNKVILEMTDSHVDDVIVLMLHHNQMNDHDFESIDNLFGHLKMKHHFTCLEDLS